MKTSTFSYIYISILFAMAAILSSCDSSVTDSSIPQSSIGYANAEAAKATFRVLSDSYTASSGTVTVTYLGDDVSVNYTSTWDPIDVAATLVNNINNDNDIKLDATVVNYSTAEVEVREERTGSQYNGNPVYLNDSIRSNHIKLSDSVINLADGED